MFWTDSQQTLNRCMKPLWSVSADNRCSVSRESHQNLSRISVNCQQCRSKNSTESQRNLYRISAKSQSLSKTSKGSQQNLREKSQQSLSSVVLVVRSRFSSVYLWSDSSEICQKFLKCLNSVSANSKQVSVVAKYCLSKVHVQRRIFTFRAIDDSQQLWNNYLSTVPPP